MREQRARAPRSDPSRDAARVSVVVPVFNDAEDLDRCLGAVNRSDWPGFECIVVDDASTDPRIAEIAARHGARLERMSRRSGPGLARNAGVACATGEVIFFTDADVMLHPDALRQAVTALDANPDVAAVFGSYDDTPDHGSFLSRYRNLYHHWNHQIGNQEASTFWTGCGAIRRAAFIGVGGFSSEFSKPSIEDIELGYRLRQAGQRILLLKTMLGTHLKRWRFWDMVRTDIFRRGVPWIVLLRLYRSAPADLNLNWKARIATVAAALLALAVLVLPLSGHAGAVVPFATFVAAAVACRLLVTTTLRNAPANRWKSALALALGFAPPLLALLAFPDPWALVPLGLMATIAWSQLGFYRLLRRRGGAGLSIAAVPLQWVFFTCCALAVPLGLIASRRRG